MSDAQPAVSVDSPLPGRRWPNVLLSLLVFGFGVYRAGRPRRFLGWLLICHAVSCATAAAFALQVVPMGILIPAMVLNIGLLLAMLRESFQPSQPIGRKGWLLFAVLLALHASLPPPASLITGTFHIPTSSMSPALRPGDRVALSRLAYRFSPVRRGDIIVFTTEGICDRWGKPFPSGYRVCRAVAFGGETVRVEDGALLINDQRMAEAEGIPPVRYMHMGGEEALLGTPSESYTVPDDAIFVLGDNSPNSSDSRSWGPVPAGNVCGRITKICWPLGRAGGFSRATSHGRPVPNPRR